jgi:hypothetical protein
MGARLAGAACIHAGDFDRRATQQEFIMKKIALLTVVLAAALALQSYTGPAQAGVTIQSFVSATGSDSNIGSGCAASAPCASFHAAVGVTYEGGEVGCLGSASDADLAATTITFSVTIDCHGAPAEYLAGVLAPNINGFVINVPGGIVTLRGLNIDGTNFPGVGGPPIGLNGVVIEAAAVVNIEDCVIENFGQNGINDQRTGSGQLFIRNTVLRNNGSSSISLSGGIQVVPGPGATVTVSVDHSQISGNYFGIVGDGTAGGTIKATISDSVISGNTEDGVAATTSGPSVWFLVDQTKVTNNAVAGLAAGGSGAEILARNSSVFDNTTGLHTANGGTIYSYGNNSVNGNTTNGAFTGTIGLQ